MYYVYVKSILNLLVRNASSRGPMYFRCLIYSLSGPCELFFALFYCRLDLGSHGCNVVSLYALCYAVNGSVCFGKSLQFLYISSIGMMFVKIMLSVCMLVGMVV